MIERAVRVFRSRDSFNDFIVRAIDAIGFGALKDFSRDATLNAIRTEFSRILKERGE